MKNKLFKSKRFKSIYIIILFLVVITSVYISFVYFQNSFRNLAREHLWILIAGTALFFFPWELYNVSKLWKSIRNYAKSTWRHASETTIDPMAKKVFTSLLIWMIAYAIVILFLNKVEKNINWALKNIFLGAFIYICGIILLRQIVKAFINLYLSKIAESSKRALNDYSLPLVSGTLLVFGLVVIIFSNFAFGDYSTTLELPPRRASDAPNVVITIEDINFSTGDVRGYATLYGEEQLEAVTVNRQVVRASEYSG